MACLPDGGCAIVGVVTSLSCDMKGMITPKSVIWTTCMHYHGIAPHPPYLALLQSVDRSQPATRGSWYSACRVVIWALSCVSWNLLRSLLQARNVCKDCRRKSDPSLHHKVQSCDDNQNSWKHRDPTPQLQLLSHMQLLIKCKIPSQKHVTRAKH